MKKTSLFIPALFLVLSLNAAAQTERTGDLVRDYPDSASENSAENSEKDITEAKTDDFDEAPFPDNDKPIFAFSEGASAAWLTRIIKQSGRSNFVFKDFMAGLYLEAQFNNIEFITPIIRLSVYYPLSSSFNKVVQTPKTPLHYAADLVLGPNFELDMLNYIRFNLSPGLHLFFLNSDRWNYINLGVAGRVGIELPVTTGWTVLIDGLASIDNGNLGTNKTIELFDIAYQYQVDLGVRYSMRNQNTYAYIKTKTPGESKFPFKLPSFLRKPDSEAEKEENYE